MSGAHTSGDGPGPVAPPTGVELRAGALRLALRPDLGACIAGLWLGELPVLVSAEPASLTSAWPSGCFVLVPYSNRLGGRRFVWQGQACSTALNNQRSVHSMHGVAWSKPWQLLSASASTAELEYRHRPDADWPFAFTARQMVALAADHLQLHLSLHNTDARPQPAGLGWHPYFPKRSHSRLQVALAGRWVTDTAADLPSHRVAQPTIDAEVAGLDFDNCFEGWPGIAHLQDEALSLTLSSDLPYLVVYTPQDKPFFCVEPVSHVNNALNMADPMAHGVRCLGPGESTQAAFRLDIAAAPLADLHPSPLP